MREHARAAFANREAGFALLRSRFLHNRVYAVHLIELHLHYERLRRAEEEASPTRGLPNRIFILLPRSPLRVKIFFTLRSRRLELWIFSLVSSHRVHGPS